MSNLKRTNHPPLHAETHDSILQVLLQVEININSILTYVENVLYMFARLKGTIDGVRARYKLSIDSLCNHHRFNRGWLVYETW